MISTLLITRNTADSTVTIHSKTVTVPNCRMDLFVFGPLKATVDRYVNEPAAPADGKTTIRCTFEGFPSLDELADHGFKQWGGDHTAD